MKTCALLSVFSGIALMFAGLGTPNTARGVDVMAPHWAYQVPVGTFMAEMRTYSGVTYRNVRVQAINAVQMQFSHSRGVNLELLTNIVDPNQYLDWMVETRPAPRQSGGRAAPAPAPREREPDPNVGVGGPLAVLLPAPQQVSMGVLKLTPREQEAVIAWARSDGSTGTRGLGLEKLTEYEKALLMEWLSARVAAARGQ